MGQVITYKLTAKNTGNVTLHNVTLTDDPSLDGYTCTPTPPATLAPGDSIVCTGSHTVTQADLDNGSFKDTAKGTSDESPPDTADDTVTADKNPKLSVSKSDDLNPSKYDHVGQVINYKLTAKNTGNVTLHNVTLTDDPSLDGYTCTPTPPATLAPGDSIVCTGSHTVTQADLDNGSFKDTAKGTSDESPPDTADDTVTADKNPML